MKKGLLLTLVLAMLSTSVFAVAPIIGNIPDIIIGDTEDNTITTDLNFFRFSNAFVFDDYITNIDDISTTPENLLWSFAKTNQPGDVGDLEINDLGYEVDHLNPTLNIRNGFSAATLRDIGASPKAQDPGPYSGPLSDLHIAMYVSDTVTVDSTEIRVTSIDGAADGYSGLGYTPTWKEPFDTQNSWAVYLGGGPGTGAVTDYFTYVSGRINLVFPSGTFSSNGSWYVVGKVGLSGFATTIDVDDAPATRDNWVYVLRSKMTADNISTVPTVRVRMLAGDFSWAQTATFGGPDGTPLGGCPSITSGYFSQIVYPQASYADIMVLYDIYNQGANYTGTLSVDEVAAYRVPVPAAIPGESKTFADLSFMAAYGGGDAGVVTLGNDITIAELNNWAAVGGMATLANPISANSVYRFKYSIYKNGAGRTDQIRPLHNDATNIYYSQCYLFSDLLASYKNVTTTAQEYISYHIGYNGPSGGNDVGLSYYMIANNQTADGASAILTQIVTEKVTFDWNLLIP